MRKALRSLLRRRPDDANPLPGPEETPQQAEYTWDVLSRLWSLASAAQIPLVGGAIASSSIIVEALKVRNMVVYNVDLTHSGE